MIRLIENLYDYVPQNEYSKFVKEYFLPINEFGVQDYISNLRVEIKFLEVNWNLVPLSFDNWNNNCYVSSILWMIEYASEESKKEKWFLTRRFFQVLLSLLSKIIKLFWLYNNIYLYNFLLSTNILPPIQEKDIQEILEFIKDRFHGKALIVRSVNEIDSQNMNLLISNDFEKIANRQIFIFRQQDIDRYLKTTCMKEDSKLIQKYNFEVKSKVFSFIDINNIKKCYDWLYLEKHSFCNPQFTKKFYQNLSNISNFSINWLTKDDEIIAVFGYYKLGDRATTPIFWYQLDKLKEFWLYRQISFLTITKSLKEVKILNHSSWAWNFKVNRGAKMKLEYMMIYYKHLKLSQRVIWKAIILLSKFQENLLKNNIY